MDGRAFLRPARDLMGGPDEPYWRTAVVNAYYALVLEARDALARWGRPVPRREKVHSFVRLKFIYAADVDLQAIGDALESLVRSRNLASYRLGPLKEFADAALAGQVVQDADDALTLLDAIEAGPARRAAAIASLPP
jgi:hypothetical protein